MMCSYCACGSICARLLTLPFRPRSAGHWMTRSCRSGNSARSFSTRASAGSLWIVHSEQQLIFRVVEQAVAAEGCIHLRIEALQRFQNAHRRSEGGFSLRAHLALKPQRCPDGQHEVSRPRCAQQRAHRRYQSQNRRHWEPFRLADRRCRGGKVRPNTVKKQQERAFQGLENAGIGLLC